MPIDYTPAQIERFWSRVVRSDDPKACWLWNGAHTDEGYGHMKIGRRMVKAHRIAWELTNGEPLGERRGRHTCDNPGCPNPEHVVPGTQIDNIRDMDERARRNVRRMTADEYRALRTCPRCGGRKSDHAALCQSCRSAEKFANCLEIHCPDCGGRKGWRAKRCLSCHRARQHR